jgi:hypothetical protein
MSGISIIILIILAGLLAVALTLLPWVIAFKRTNHRISQTLQNEPQKTSVYRARNDHDAVMGELYVSRDRIWFEKSKTKLIDVSAQEIEKIVYSKRSIQIILANGQRHLLRYLHLPPDKDGVLYYWSGYSVMYNDKDALVSLLNDLHNLNIPAEEGSTGKESTYYYVALLCAIFSIMAIAIWAILDLF